MRLLALDISTNTGWAVFVNGELKDFGLLSCKNSDINYKEFNEKSSIAMKETVLNFGEMLRKLVRETAPHEIVIEQTNMGRARFTQKLLEWMHFVAIYVIEENTDKHPKYMDSSQWRKAVDLKLTKEDKKHNALIKKTGKRGKIGKKHLAVRIVNSMFNLNFKMKDNDKADAILLGLAYLKEVENERAK